MRDEPRLISELFHRIGLIYNPFAGGLKGSKRARLDRAVATFEKAGKRVDLMPTERPNQAGLLAARALEEGCDLVLAAGGDGTINEAVNGLAGSRVLFGVLPSGTANVLANEVGLAGRPDHAARQLLEAVPARISLGRVQSPDADRYFLLLAGIGLDARIVKELDLDLKRKIGKLAYWHGGFRQFGRAMPKFRIRANGEEFAASFALVTRVRNYGGDFEIARRVRLTDDDFEVIITQRQQWSHFLKFIIAVACNRLDKLDSVVIARASSVELTAPDDDEVYIQADGEALWTVPASITTVPDALTLLLPKQYLAR